MGQDSRHPPVDPPRTDETTGLSTSRADFSVSLAKRVDALYEAIAALEHEPTSTPRRDYLLQRLHALQASAKVLGFAAAADILTRAEHRLRTAQVDTLVDDLTFVRRHLADLPGMVQRGSYSIAPPAHSDATPHSRQPLSARASLEPFSVLLFGTTELATTLLQTQPPHSGLEIVNSTSSSDLRPLAAALGPDAIVLDVAQGSIALLVDELTQSSETSAIPILALNVPDEIASSLEELGVRATLSSRATDTQILRALYSTRKIENAQPRILPPFGELSLPELATRIAQEIQQGLVDGATGSAHTERVSLGEGTEIRAAVWSAIAQIREHLVEQSDGRLQFDRGPDGSIPLAPGPRTFARGHAPSTTEVDLTGRRILVADDDPAVAWLVGGTLRAAGAIVTEAHDGNRALELAYRLWPEVVVSDILMPGLDGFALCHLLKRDVMLRDVPIVLLSWKEDLLFRLRDLGSDADGYLRKEATASTIVKRVQELLAPRRALELRIARSVSSTQSQTREARGRLDATTVRQLLEIACNLDRPVRIALRDSAALYDLRVREGSLKALTRTYHDGTVARGHSVLMELIGVTAGRFSVTPDFESLDPEFDAPLAELLRPYALRARAAQRVLSGLSLGLVDQLSLEHDAFSEELPTLPLSLRPVADELRRGTAPRSLLASGVASVHVLESLLADVARRGKVRAITGVKGEDLLEQEILALAAVPVVTPPKPAPAPTPLFTFQLSPSPPEVHERTAMTPSTAPKAVQLSIGVASPDPEADPASAPEQNVSTRALAEASRNTAPLPVAAAKLSKAPASDDVDWALELNWDSTPPPTSNANEDSRDIPTSKPATSGGFMRPTLATLERRSHGETPDLANAVALAVSTTTPLPEHSPAVADHRRRAGTASPSPEIASTNREPIAPGPQDQPTVVTNPSLNEPKTEQGLSPLPKAPEPNLSAPVAADDAASFAPAHTSTSQLGAALPPGTQTPPDTQTSASLTTLVSSVHPPTIAQDEPIKIADPAATLDAVAQGTELTANPVGTPNLPPAYGPAKLDGPRDLPAAPSNLPATGTQDTAEGLSVTAPLVNPPPLTPIESRAITAPSQPYLPTNSPSIVSTISIPTIDVAVKTANFEAATQTSTATPAGEPRPDKLTPLLPVVQNPARPTPIGPGIREYDSDPVFPLVSAAPPAVEIQPAIEVGDAPSTPPASTTDAPEDDAGNAAPNRDTLRSPGDSTPVPLSIPNNAAPNVSTQGATEGTAEPTSQTDQTSAPGAEATLTYESNNGALAPQARSTTEGDPTPSSVHRPQEPDRGLAPDPAVQTVTPSTRSDSRTRQISWVQALGLSFLAGLVTFALTVPVARWWRERGHEHEAAPSTTPQQIQPPAGPEPAAATVASSSLAAGDPSSEPNQPTATIEDIPLPADVSLSPSQGLLEVVTAGGHAVFLDDSFVGRGPVRVVTVAPGRHTVRTRLNGVERTDSIEIGAGQSKRLSLEKAWK